MPEHDVTVAIPVRDGGELFVRTLRALERQTVAHELVVCDSGSRDGSPALASAHGARVLEIEPGEFNHGGTRNLLLREARGGHVALLTQDAEPADERWLERLLEGFAPAENVGLVYGPYLARPDASPAVRTELEGWFSSLSPDGEPHVGERLSERELQLSAGELVRRHNWELVGRRGFFTDANACLARGAWERVPFRKVPYAEDRLLALDMLRAGYAKAYVPHAAVVHSHAYTPSEHLRRSFDEWRGLREVYGWREPASPRYLVGQLRGALGPAHRELRRGRRWSAAARRGACGCRRSPHCAPHGRRARLACGSPAAGRAASTLAGGPRRLRAARARPHRAALTRRPGGGGPVARYP